MTSDPFEPDCSNCAALCCVGFAFVEDQGFAYDKPADAPCRHLLETGLCAIHADRKTKGMEPCSLYTCHGAGQYVTQELFAGQTWQKVPQLLAPMTEVFRELSAIRAELVLLKAAEKMDLPPQLRDELQSLIAETDPADGWTVEALREHPSAGIKARVRKLLASLRSHISR